MGLFDWKRKYVITQNTPRELIKEYIREMIYIMYERDGGNPTPARNENNEEWNKIYNEIINYEYSIFEISNLGLGGVYINPLLDKNGEPLEIETKYKPFKNIEYKKIYEIEKPAKFPWLAKFCTANRESDRLYTICYGYEESSHDVIRSEYFLRKVCARPWINNLRDFYNELAYGKFDKEDYNEDIDMYCHTVVHNETMVLPIDYLNVYYKINKEFKIITIEFIFIPFDLKITNKKDYYKEKYRFAPDDVFYYYGDNYKLTKKEIRLLKQGISYEDIKDYQEDMFTEMMEQTEN